MHETMHYIMSFCNLILTTFVHACHDDASVFQFGYKILISSEQPQQDDFVGPRPFCPSALILVKNVKPEFNAGTLTMLLLLAMV